MPGADAGGDACASSTWYRDGDGDGHGDPGDSQDACAAPSGFVASSDDCDDADDTVYAAAPELCDEQDNDCDETVDEEIAYSTYYADSDADGYGDAAATMDDCVPPAGHVSDSSDCDDGDAAIHPDATETCNAADDDCDDAVDEEVMGTFYEDADGDGYGNAASIMTGCSAPAGHVSDSTDCNDGCTACHPTGTETCDTRDNDCDGTVDEGNPEGGANCGTDVGACSFGTMTCVSGTLSCVGGVGPMTETCNGADDDCDASVDEFVTTTYYQDCDADGYAPLSPETREACSLPTTPPSGTGCSSGTWTSTAPTDGVNDCHDLSSDVHPGATGWHSSERPDIGGYDYDCNGTEERRYTRTGSCGSSTSNCVGYWNYTYVPACGSLAVDGNWQPCGVVGLACTEVGSATALGQECR